MQWLGARYSRWFNWRHGQTGHLFQSRYQAILMDRQAYLLELARYLALNPVRAGLVRDPGDWPWSSYRATAGRTAAPDWLETGWLLAQLAPQPGPARKAYAGFVAEGMGPATGWRPEPRGGVLGGESFRTQLADRLGLPADGAARPSLIDLAGRGQPRGAWMAAAQDQHGYRQREIAAFTGLERSAISKIITSWRARRGT